MLGQYSSDDQIQNGFWKHSTGKKDTSSWESDDWRSKSENSPVPLSLSSYLALPLLTSYLLLFLPRLSLPPIVYLGSISKLTSHWYKRYHNRQTSTHGMQGHQKLVLSDNCLSIVIRNKGGSLRRICFFRGLIGSRHYYEATYVNMVKRVLHRIWGLLVLFFGAIFVSLTSLFGENVS